MNPSRKCIHLDGRPAGMAPVIILLSLILSLTWLRAALAAGTWSETGRLIDARYSHTATRLADGRILVAGGYGEHGYLASAELFDPATGRWSATGSLNTARSRHTATRLADGRVLVVGGTGGIGGHLDSAEVYNPATGTWSNTDSLTYGRFLHTATLLYDGRVLVAGGAHRGRSTASIEIYDPETGTWSRSAMDTARYDHTATRLANGRVLVGGGIDNSDAFEEEYLASADIFNPADGTWSAPDPLIGGRARHTATLLNDGRVLVVGGWNPGVGYLITAKLFNPADGTWNNADSLPYEGFEYHTATRLTDYRILVTGGYNNGFAQSKVELFNPADRSWTIASHLEHVRYWHTGTLLYDGRVLVAGGAGPGPLASAEVHDPQNYIRNGSFETASVDPGAVVTDVISLADGSTAITHWTVGDGGVDYREDWQAAEGRRSLDLNYVDGGSITQVFYTNLRTRYLVTFALAGNPGGVQGIKTLRVSAMGQSRDFSFDTTGKSKVNMGWTTQTFSFTSNGILPISDLEFKSLTPGTYGPALDKVRVVKLVPMLMPMLQLLLE